MTIPVKPGARQAKPKIAKDFQDHLADLEARGLLLRIPETMHGVVARGLDCHPLWHLGV